MEISMRAMHVQALVLSVLSDGVGRTPREISKPNRLNSVAVQKALLALCREKAVTRSGPPGYYVYRIARQDAAE